MSLLPDKITSSPNFSPSLDNEEEVIPLLKGLKDRTIMLVKDFLLTLHTDKYNIHSIHPCFSLLSEEEINKIFDTVAKNNNDTKIMHEEDQYEMPSLKQYLISNMIEKIDKSIECLNDRDSREVQRMALNTARHVVFDNALFTTEYSEWESIMNSETTWNMFKEYWNGLYQEN